MWFFVTSEDIWRDFFHFCAILSQNRVQKWSLKLRITNMWKQIFVDKMWIYCVLPARWRSDPNHDSEPMIHESNHKSSNCSNIKNFQCLLFEMKNEDTSNSQTWLLFFFIIKTYLACLLVQLSFKAWLILYSSIVCIEIKTHVSGKVCCTPKYMSLLQDKTCKQTSCYLFWIYQNNSIHLI